MTELDAPEGLNFPLLPYSYIEGQETLRRMLEIAYVMGPKDGGVLVSGERGTAKSTIVRSFAHMLNGGKGLPVTLPINATDDRVMGGWEIEPLVGKGDLQWKPGLLQRAGRANVKMLYIDEVNLLDDHIINLILDVISTGFLVVEREGFEDEKVDVSFLLVGTMNPDEGALRPQLLDRFSLFVPVTAEEDLDIRRNILFNVLKFDTERGKESSEWLRSGRHRDAQHGARLDHIRQAALQMDPTEYPAILDTCTRIAKEFNVVGHRAEIVMARAACAAAAIAALGEPERQWAQRVVPTLADVVSIAPYAIMHRRRDAAYADGFEWLDADNRRLTQVISKA